jgi:hypothetical protein
MSLHNLRVHILSYGDCYHLKKHQPSARIDWLLSCAELFTVNSLPIQEKAKIANGFLRASQLVWIWTLLWKFWEPRLYAVLTTGAFVGKNSWSCVLT